MGVDLRVCRAVDLGGRASGGEELSSFCSPRCRSLRVTDSLRPPKSARLMTQTLTEAFGSEGFFPLDWALSLRIDSPSSARR